MPSNTYIYFGIRGEFDPNDLASRIGMAPTKSAARHSRDPERKIPRCSTLRFAQTHADAGDEAVDLYGLADAVYQKLKDHKDKIAQVVKTHDVVATFQVVLEFPVSDDVPTPAIGFSPGVVNFVAEVGASIDIDTYRV